MALLIRLPVAAAAVLEAQRNSSVYQIGMATCYHEDEALQKREELVRIVTEKSCKVFYVDPLYGSFYFIIPRGVNNPLSGITDKQTHVAIQKFDHSVGTMTPCAHTNATGQNNA
ncbi:hypothetical protein HBI88_100800 [Parastagonospora nodorum]|nr:hypothetical protein HBH61_138370 [Parastagonospora nodorum]KAH5074541.1 hypothetical protein HBH95_144280 [Parastagonospora nodorum]KAH5788527.1 hypothetical protein HBI97_074760 [Parastagonospora nodorum]KAH5814358.1 hypothetical protein HBI96_072080 [Parastagonospora nodorum]KAH5828493.1 hypothetical protein HBI94_056500 [Parastagonospora nodorum]